MENTGGILGRLGEKVLGWIALALLVGLGIAIWQMGPEMRGQIWGGIWRTSVWLVFSAGWPWVTALFVSRLLELSTNWAGLALIGGLTLVNLVVGLLLLQGLPAGIWGWLAGLTALGVVGTYNYLVAEYLAERAGG